MISDIRKALVKFSALAQEIGERFSRVKQKQDFVTKVASYRIPEVVELLVKKGFANEGDKKLLADSLRDHAKCLLYIEKLANYARPGSFGTVLYGKSNDNRRTRAIGQVISEDETEAGRAFREAFLRLSVP